VRHLPEFRVPLSHSDHMRLYALELAFTVLKTKRYLVKEWREKGGLEIIVDILKLPEKCNNRTILCLCFVQASQLEDPDFLKTQYRLGLLDILTDLSRSRVENLKHIALLCLNRLTQKDDMAKFKKDVKKADLTTTAQEMLETISSSKEQLKFRKKSLQILVETAENRESVKKYVIEEFLNNGKTLTVLKQILNFSKPEVYASDSVYPEIYLYSIGDSIVIL
jgi:hypothetical protein